MSLPQDLRTSSSVAPNAAAPKPLNVIVPGAGNIPAPGPAPSDSGAAGGCVAVAVSPTGATGAAASEAGDGSSARSRQPARARTSRTDEVTIGLRMRRLQRSEEMATG